MKNNRVVWIALLLALAGLIFATDLHQLITLDNFKASQAEVDTLVAAQPVTAAAAYFAVYVLMAAINIPGAAVMTLIAGALFGVVQGTVLVSFASSIGATLAFLLSRFLLRDYVEQRFGTALERLNQGVNKEGAYYLFTLRLVPVFPFFAINMMMGMTRIRVSTYYWVSQLGMLPATVVFVNAGTQIGALESLSGILSPALLGSFVLLGLFPLLTRKLLNYFNYRKLMKKYSRPQHFDTNMVVIGAGSAGLVTAYIAAAAKAKVTLIEREKMGGDCLNTGCVPSKAIIRSSRIAKYIDRAAEFGLSANASRTDFPAVMRRVRDVIGAIAPHDSIQRYTELGVDCVAGSAKITSPWSVDVNGRTINTRSIVIASGGKPAVPPIPGLDEVGYLTSDSLWELKELPKQLLVMGGGAIGCELAQAFRRLGSSVTLVEMQDRLLSIEDPEITEHVERSFTRDGIKLLLNTKVTKFEQNDGSHVAVCETTADEEIRIEFDYVLVAAGRRGNTEGLGLENIGIETNRNGTVPVNDYLQTSFPNIYACGDVAGPYQLTHAAAHQAWYCAMNALFGRLWRFRVDYSVMPRAVFCSPEVASVGLSEQAAQASGIPYHVTTYKIDDLDRAIADGEAEGVVRVLTPPNSDKILGVAIVGPHAGDTISEYVLAMRNGLGLSKILGTVHIYPTLAEANKFAAGNWRKNNLSAHLLSLSAWWNRRGIT
jgi:dihydrolipoamide dehydrogenase